MYRIAHRIVGRTSDAEDVRQEVFATVFGKPDRIPDPERYEAWLRRCTVNAAIARVRRRGREEPVESPVVASPEREPEDRAVRREEATRLREALDRLAADDRAILALRFDEELTFAEIAETLDRPASTVKSRYARLLEELRSVLGTRQESM